MMKKNTMIRRITTGFAAAAACAVFACGGWFIYQQAKQQTLNSDENSVTEISQTGSSLTDLQEESTNFLGGLGEIRILGKGMQDGPGNDAVLYDDTRWYFSNASLYAHRTGEDTVEYSEMRGHSLLSKLFG